MLDVEPSWFKWHLPSYTAGFVSFKGICKAQFLQYHDKISQSKTFPLVIEMAAPTPFNELYPRHCQVPPNETPISLFLLFLLFQQQLESLMLLPPPQLHQLS